MKKILAISLFIIIVGCSFITMQPAFIRPDSDAELTVTDVKVKLIGIGEYAFTQVNGNFYSPVGTPTTTANFEKLYNNDVYVNDIPTMFSFADSTYQIIDTTLNTSVNNNFSWEFPDLANSNNIIQYTTTKPITRVSQFDLSGLTSVSRSSGFSYSHSLIQADSITYVLGTDSLTSLKKTVYTQSYGVSFSPTELSGLTASNEGAFLILVFNTMPKLYNGKKYYFQNNSMVMAMPLPVN